MSTYRTSMMLYSSVLALTFMTASDGFCDGKELKADVKSEEKKVETKEITGAPVPEVDEAKHDQEMEARLIIKEKKAAFRKKINEVTEKYANLLKIVTGTNEDIESKLRAHIAAKGQELLSTLTAADKAIFESFATSLKRKYDIILSQKESVGEDLAWFKEVYTATEKQLKRLEKLRDGFEKDKLDPEKTMAAQEIYTNKISNLLESYSVFAMCAHYLGAAKVFCNDEYISHNNMKAEFPDFSSKAFRDAAIPDDVLTGKRAPLATIKGYKLYAIDQKTYKKDEFLSGIPADSKDGKFIAAAKDSPDFQKLLDPETGGLVLSSRMIQKAGMSRPICVFYTFAIDAKQDKEIVSRFSLVHDSEESQEKQLTVQLIAIENAPAHNELVAAVTKLQEKVVKDEKDAISDKKKVKKNKDAGDDKAKVAEDKAKGKAGSAEKEATAKEGVTAKEIKKEETKPVSDDAIDGRKYKKSKTAKKGETGPKVEKEEAKPDQGKATKKEASNKSEEEKKNKKGFFSFLG